MRWGRKARIFRFTWAVMMVALLSATGLALVQQASLFDSPISGNPIGRDVTIARVNGEPVTLRALERMKQIFESNDRRLQERDAYRQSMENLIRHRVLVQEARRRGISVSDQEAKDRLTEMSSYLEKSPEMARAMEAQKRALGLSDASYERELLKAYRELLMIERLYQALHHETPPPSAKEAASFSEQQEGPNTLILIPIEVADVDSARALFQEIQASTASLSADELVTAFDGYARVIGGRGMEELVHQTFHFGETSELPDYARDAVTRGVNEIGLFERKNKTAVIYLVLESILVTPEEAGSRAREQLTQARQTSHARQVEEDLMKEAEVQYFPASLPPAAREALVDR